MKLRPLPPMLTGIIFTAILACDRTRYHVEGRCPSCGGELSGYDLRRKRFAVVVEDGNELRLEVILHRAYCRSCGRILVPEGPFYPGTRAGAPVVDLCRALGATMPYSRVATVLSRIGIVLDRGSVRSYCRSAGPMPPVVGVFGLNLPVSIVSLSSLAGTAVEGKSIRGTEILAACNLLPGKTASATSAGGSPGKS